MKQVLVEHLVQPTYYDNLTPAMAQTELSKQKDNFLKILGTHITKLPSEAERTYFDRALVPTRLEQYKVPQFYGIYKVHKSGPPKLRPIVSCVNSLPEVFSKWVDHWLKKMRTHACSNLY